MSVLTQFFGGGGGGSSKLTAEILVVAGGGGGSCFFFSAPYGPSYGQVVGDGGALIHNWYDLQPGTTYPITVGAGGASLANPYAPPTYKYGVAGGASKFGTIAETASCPTCFPGCPGGSCAVSRPTFVVTRVSNPQGNTSYTSIWSSSSGDINGMGGYQCANCSGTNNASIPTVKAPYGCQLSWRKGSGAAADAYGQITTRCTLFCRNVTYIREGLAYLCVSDIDSAQRGSQVAYISNITGSVCEYGGSYYGYAYAPSSIIFVNHICTPGISNPWDTSCPSGGIPPWHCGGTGTGTGGWFSPGCSGQPGTVIVKYPDDFGAATTSSPNVCDCSPQTPGFKTYRFLCPGTITLP